MKIKLNTNLIVNIIIIGFIALAVVLIAGSIYFTSGPSSDTMQPIPTKTTATDYVKYFDSHSYPHDNDVPDNVGYNQYFKLRDSVTTMNALKNGVYSIGGGAFLDPVLETTQGLYCDTCSFQRFHNGDFKREETKTMYYIVLPGWKINDSKWGHEGIYSDGKIESVLDMPVKFKYNDDQCLMILVSKTTQNIITIVLVLNNILLILYVLYLISGLLKFILDLSKGLSFTDKNVRRLRLIAFSLLVYPMAIFFLNLLLRLIFHSYFNGDFILNNDVWNRSWKIIIVGLVFLALWKAFRQGKKLKDEHDLTV